MPIHAHDAVERDPSEKRESPGRHDDSDIHELREDEFFLEPDEPTLELQSGAPPSAARDVGSPQLPRWAAASRVLLDSLRSDEETTLELPWGAFVPGVSLADEGASGADSSARAELARAGEQVRAREAYLGEIELALASASGRIKGQAFRIAELEAALAALTLLPSPAALVAAPLVAPAADPADRVDSVESAPDDLQLIDGIGPRFAQRLATLGVETFDAIASWAPADVSTIARALGIGPARIKQQAWIKQARALRAKSVRSRSARLQERRRRSP
jgi:predicted flap endonuclease-1-like 5' DNA nuclease